MKGRRRDGTRGGPVQGEATADRWGGWDPERPKLGGMLELGVATGISGGEDGV